MEEIFTDILGYETLYQVSNLGRIKSLPKGDGNGHKTRFLKVDTVYGNHTNYHRVSLSKNGIVNRISVHRLVAQAFIPNPENKPFVNHIDNDGTNNAASNLEWCTAVENMAHSSSQGRQNNPRILGGQAAGLLLKEKAAARHLSVIGNTYGALTVISFIIDDTLVKPRFKLVCKCSCGNTTHKSMYKVLRGTATCIECSYKLR